MKGHKVVSAQEMARIETIALQSGCDEENFIAKAGFALAQIAREFIQKHNLSKNVILLVGKGHNGADALATGVELLKQGFSAQACLVSDLAQCRPLCKKWAELFNSQGGKSIGPAELKDFRFSSQDLIIDGLLGIGSRGSTEGLFQTLIENANKSRAPILAIDIPSGLNPSTGKASSFTIRATVTAALGLPKLGWFIGDGWNYVGKWKIADFGLPSYIVDQALASAYLPTHENALESLPPIRRTQHKYQAGFVVGYSGSTMYSGAAKLAALAALRGGAGIVKLFYPKSALLNMLNTPFEIIHRPWNEKAWDADSQRAQSLFIGPGIIPDSKTERVLKKILPEIKCKLVLDAGALLSSISIPAHAICTPHRGEAPRLLNVSPLNESELLHACQTFCDTKRTILVLKGAPTWVFSPDEKPTIIAYGDPGMATAGSGDVLTGLIAALLARGCTPLDAAILGAIIHGVAGERAAQEKGSSCMIASDIILHFPQAFC